MYACRRGRWDFAKALLGSGASVNLRQSKNGASALWLLVTKTGNVEMPAALIDEFGADASIVDDAGRTLLHEAASLGRKRLVEWLTSRPEVDLMAKDVEGKTALDAAKSSNTSRPEIVAYLKMKMRKKFGVNKPGTNTTAMMTSTTTMMTNTTAVESSSPPAMALTRRKPKSVS